LPVRSARLVAVVAVVAVVIAVAAVAIRMATQPRSASQRLEAAQRVVSAIHVVLTASGSSLAAATAVADFGVGRDVRLVHVRILDELHLELMIEAPADIVLAEAPRICLVGPFPAPDDAGLTDRCWGEPDLGALVAEQLVADAAGRPQLARGPLLVSAVLRRGDVRCDYPPGTWQVETSFNPLIDGTPAGSQDLPPVDLVVPFAGTQPLQLVKPSRYCGLASQIYNEQGEPPMATP
jgi:hypothetical protein